MEYKNPGRYIPVIYLLYSWGSRFGVPRRVPLEFVWYPDIGLSSRSITLIQTVNIQDKELPSPVVVALCPGVAVVISFAVRNLYS